MEPYNHPNFPASNSELNAVLHEFVKSVQAVLGENLVSAYLQGSFAIGDWDDEISSGQWKMDNRWAKSKLDNRWAGLIQKAWDDRPNPTLKGRQSTKPRDVKKTPKFVRYVLELGQSLEVNKL